MSYLTHLMGVNLHSNNALVEGFENMIATGLLT